MPRREGKAEGKRSGSCRTTVVASRLVSWLLPQPSHLPPPASPLAVVCSQYISQRDPIEQELEVGCSSTQSPSKVAITLGVQRALKAHFPSLVKFIGRYFIFIIIVSPLPL